MDGLYFLHTSHRSILTLYSRINSVNGLFLIEKDYKNAVKLEKKATQKKKNVIREN